MSGKNVPPEAVRNPPSPNPAYDESHPERESRAEHTADDPTPAILAYLITAGFFMFLTSLVFVKPPDSNLAMLNIVLGSLGTAWLGAIAYFFGGTAGRMMRKAAGSATNIVAQRQPE